jgi:hypothetical protein
MPAGKLHEHRGWSLHSACEPSSQLTIVVCLTSCCQMYRILQRVVHYIMHPLAASAAASGTAAAASAAAAPAASGASAAASGASAAAALTLPVSMLQQPGDLFAACMLSALADPRSEGLELSCQAQTPDPLGAQALPLTRRSAAARSVRVLRRQQHWSVVNASPCMHAAVMLHQSSSMCLH